MSSYYFDGWNYSDHQSSFISSFFFFLQGGNKEESIHGNTPLYGRDQKFTWLTRAIGESAIFKFLVAISPFLPGYLFWAFPSILGIPLQPAKLSEPKLCLLLKLPSFSWKMFGWEVGEGTWGVSLEGKHIPFSCGLSVTKAEWESGNIVTEFMPDSYAATKHAVAAQKSYQAGKQSSHWHDPWSERLLQSLGAHRHNTELIRTLCKTKKSRGKKAS